MSRGAQGPSCAWLSSQSEFPSLTGNFPPLVCPHSRIMMGFSVCIVGEARDWNLDLGYMLEIVMLWWFVKDNRMNQQTHDV